MKMWRFYIKPNKEYGERDYRLYALTNKKKLAKRFKKERDMNKFIVKSSSVDREEYSEFANDNRGSVLGIYSMITDAELESGYYGHPETCVLCTFFEYQQAADEYTSTEVTEPFYYEDLVPAAIFTKKMFKALNVLQYDKFYKLYGAQSLVNNYIDMGILTDDYSAPDVINNELGIFIRLFGSLFK